MLIQCKNLLAAKPTMEMQTRRESSSSNTNRTTELSLTTPVQDYQKVMDIEVHTKKDDLTLKENFSNIGIATRETIWKLVFSQQPESTLLKNRENAAKLLKAYKDDCCFYSPWDYNEWIPKLRDEILQQNMLDFWKDEVVKNELGPCWARDCDFFSDTDDPAVEKFYNHGGCVAPAPFKNDRNMNSTSKPVAAKGTVGVTNSEASNSVSTDTVTSPPVYKISLNNPVQDYTAKMQYQVQLNCDDINELREIFLETQQVIWQLLFSERALTDENYKKAELLLGTYRDDASFYDPFMYNSWIPTVREELFKRKYFDFWKNVIVNKKYGLLSYRDCDFFDDTEDTRPTEFYEKKIPQK